MSLSITVNMLGGRFDEAMREIQRPIYEASLKAMDDFADVVEPGMRQRAGAAGFSKRWQNTLRVEVYANKKTQDPAVVVFSRIPYAGVFAEGATITPQSFDELWFPLPWTPKRYQRKKMTAGLFADKIAPLFPMRAKSGRKMLGARMAVSKRIAKAGGPYKPTIGRLTRAKTDRTVYVTVPLFMGVRSVTIPQKFDVQAEIDAAISKFPEFYLKHLNADG